MRPSHTDQMFELMSQGIWQVDANGRTTYVNSRMAAMVGYSREEFVKLSPLDLVRAEDRDWIAARIASRRQGVRDDYECQIARKDGAWASVTVEALPLFRDDGAHDGTLALVTDITERTRAAAALRESEARYRTLVEWVPEPSVVHRRGEILYANPAAARLFGATAAQDLVGKPILDLIHPDSRALVLARVKAADERGLASPPIEETYLRLDGTPIVVEVQGTPIPYNGEPAIYAVIRDITARKHADAALKHAADVLRGTSERLQLLLDSAAEGVYGLDMDGACTFSNSACVRMLGYERSEDLLGRNMHDLVHAKHADDTPYPAADCPIFRAFASGEAVHVDSEVLWRKDGTRFFAEYWSHPIRRDGNVLGAVVTFMDITERKRAEQALRESEERLNQAQKMESVGRLAGGVAHDFNNMLGVILGNLEAALGDVDPSSPLHEDLEAAREAAMRSADLTRQLLAFARKQTVTPKVLDLNDTVAGMLKLLERLIGEDVAISWRPAEGLWRLKVDPSQIDQTLTNLCVNARDAIAGVGTLIIETRNVTLDQAACAAHDGAVPGDYVRLSVADDGCGMDDETQARLFEPFFTTKGVGKGTGLGLATVYGIVKQNNGFVEVESELGHGTTFKLYLPRHRVTTGPLRPDAMARPASRGHETILLVEDEAAILRLTRRMLEAAGYTVLTAGTPGDAIRLAEAYRGEVHLLITDVVMPEMNGRDLAKNLLATHPGMKRLFMSGYTADVIASHGVLDEGVHFIQKPFARQDLATKVRGALDDHPAG
jgi:PAS domain S-box-containing protein